MKNAARTKSAATEDVTVSQVTLLVHTGSVTKVSTIYPKGCAGPVLGTDLWEGMKVEEFFGPSTVRSFLDLPQ